MRYCCQSFITVFKMPRELFNLEQVLCQHVGLIFFIGSVRKLDPEPGQGSCWFLSIRDLAGLCSTSHIHREVPHTNVYIARVLLAKSWAVGQKAHWFLSFPMLSSNVITARWPSAYCKPSQDPGGHCKHTTLSQGKKPPTKSLMH